ncbi:hypothetical protein PQR71_35220 [Paraburkholderia fungorum]|uniref:hypothetical protein n=1 Tax=Paraburkholderia fungorum TaxID=134537 RepID=UPI0038BD60BE
MSATDKKPGVGRRIARASLYMIPGYPIVKALQSAKNAVGSGAATVLDLKEELNSSKTRSRRVRTWNEAIANRAADAQPLEIIERDCVRKKQVCLIFAFVCASYALGGLLGGNYIAVFSGLLGMAWPSLFTVREEHRLWQMETGPTNPDAPLGSYRQFFRTRGVVKRLLNPRLF